MISYLSRLYFRNATFPAILSISYIFFNISIILPLKIILLYSSSTASCLVSISFFDISGSFIHLVKSLAPIDVFVLSSIPKKTSVSYFRSFILCVSSRFFLAILSKTIYLFSDIIYILLRCFNSCICVSFVYL